MYIYEISTIIFESRFRLGWKFKAAFDGNICEQTCFKQKFKMQ